MIIKIKTSSHYWEPRRRGSGVSEEDVKFSLPIKKSIDLGPIYQVKEYKTPSRATLGQLNDDVSFSSLVGDIPFLDISSEITAHTITLIMEYGSIV